MRLWTKIMILFGCISWGKEYLKMLVIFLSFCSQRMRDSRQPRQRATQLSIFRKLQVLHHFLQCRVPAIPIHVCLDLHCYYLWMAADSWLRRWVSCSAGSLFIYLSFFIIYFFYEWCVVKETMLAIFNIIFKSRKQWNPDITMYQGNGKITSLYRGIAMNKSSL